MRIKFYMLVSFLCVFICGCNDDEASRPYPRVTTDGVISISDEGALFQGFITSYDENKISLVGFVWSDNSDPRLDKSEVVFLSPEVINENRFTFSLRSTLDAGKSYWVRAFAIQDEFRVYGDTTSFISQGSSSNPVIEEFEPKSGTDSSEITISGEGFSHKNEENKVSFGNLEARVISSSVEELKVLVPAGISTRESTLTVEVTGNAFIAETKFQRLAPIITDFDPKDIICTESIVITGNNFGITTESNKVFFDDFEGVVLNASPSELEVKPPIGLKGTYDLSVETAGQRVTALSSVNLDIDLTCDESLIAYYPFNGNANDESVNSNHGVVNGASLTEDRNGNANSAYSFDGVDDYIKLGDDFDFNELTINIWFKVIDYTVNSDLIFSIDHSSKQNGLLAIASIEINGQLNLRYNRNGEIVDILTDNEWQMATMIYEGSDYSFFLNGVIVGSGTDDGDINSRDGVSDATVGCDRKYGRLFNGLIDDIRIYDRELAITEIEALYNEME